MGGCSSQPSKPAAAHEASTRAAAPLSHTTNTTSAPPPIQSPVESDVSSFANNGTHYHLHQSIPPNSNHSQNSNPPPQQAQAGPQSNEQPPVSPTPSQQQQVLQVPPQSPIIPQSPPPPPTINGAIDGGHSTMESPPILPSIDEPIAAAPSPTPAPAAPPVMPIQTLAPQQQYEQPPVPILPDDARFTPSTNGRNGWRFEQIYTAGAELGHGAFGSVFIGTHKFANNNAFSFEPQWKDVAIKKTTPNALDLRGGRSIRTYDELEERCQEIKTLIRLQEGSPMTSSVLFLYEYFMAGKDFYMVTERLGQELDDWRSQCEVFTEKMAIDICRTILQGLAFCESRKVVHRDVKLQNILFRETGNFRTLKLVDFGLACALEGDQLVRDFCGSIGYIAPEIYLGKPYRYEVDMFAFGVLLFRLLSGERPFPSNNSQILKRHTVELRYNVHGEDWASVSSSAKDLVRKLLINRKERLTAGRALRHRWFSEIGESVLRPDRTSSIRAQPHQDPSRSRAVVRSQAPAASLDRVDGSRFWMDSEVEMALATIMSYDIYSGEVVERTRNVENATTVLMCVRETKHPDCIAVPDFITTLQCYTEKDCRAICLELTKCIEILHNAGIAHRNLHLDNVQIDLLGKVRLKGLQYAQPIREDQPMTGHFGYLYSWFAFKAPEVDSEFAHDKSIDLWSLGAVICFLLTGLPPFRGTAMDLIEAKQAGKIEFEVCIPSEPAQDLVRGLLKVDPTERFTIEDVLNHEWMIEADDYLERFELDVAYAFLKDWKNV